MKISIFGAGYVGVTSAVYFADHGYYVNIVDVNSKKIELLNQGESPIDNEEVKQLVKKNWKENRILATNDSQKAVEESDISLICVGTPTDLKGEVELNSVFSVFRSIGKGLQSKKGYHLIILRSTCPPGTTRQGLEIVQKISGKKAGHDFGGCMCPEFLRGWSLIEDFYNPPFTIIGQFDKKSGDLGELLFQGINAELIRTELEIAEMVKYVCNAFHALKASFANEIGRICKQMGIDSREVMNIFMKDTKLNLSGRYLMPGFAFGGSCLPKDVKALTKLGKKVGVNPVLLESILNSNDMHIEYLVDKIVKLKPKKVGIV
jgi:GDP-mannose 6-dehydrogenase